MLRINLAAVGRNWQKLNNMSAGVAGAVVKANGYGLGAEKIAEALYSVGCRHFFVATVEGAVRLRPHVGNAHIYALHGVYNNEELSACVKENIRPVVNHFKMWQFLRDSGAPLHVALHFDTGMHRLGIPDYEVDEIASSHKGSLKIDLIMSHYASKELNVPENEIQLERFEKIKQKFPNIQTSFGNSAGVFSDGKFHGDITRPGFAVYGGNPIVGGENPMENVLQITPRVLQTQSVKKGEAVGYNGLWVAPEDSEIATVEVGYNDVNPLDAEVYAGSNKLEVIGRYSMDMLTLNVTNIREHNITIVPKLEGLAGYHCLTSLGERLKREYVYD